MKENKLVATFIGMQKTDIGWFDSEGMLSQHIYDETGGNCHDTLQFKVSFDWIMSTMADIKIILNSDGIENREGWKKHYDLFSSYDLLNIRIDYLYKEIIDFIKWYGED